MDEQDHLRATKLEQLRQDVRAGLDSGAAAAWDAANVKQAERARRQTTAGAEIAEIWDCIAEGSDMQADTAET